MIRAFIAIDLTDEVRASLAAAQAQLKQTPLKVKVLWTKVENLHLTLQFLGRLPESQVGQISVALDTVAGRHAPTEVTVAGGGAFPDDVKPRVLWLGCVGASLNALANDVRAAMIELGFKPDEHEFIAHLTLG